MKSLCESNLEGDHMSSSSKKSEENKMKLEGMDETARQIEEVNQEYNRNEHKV